MFVPAEYFKVGEVVVLPVSVFVMNRFVSFQFPAEVKFDDSNMLKDVWCLSWIWVVGCIGAYISVFVNTKATPPCWMEASCKAVATGLIDWYSATLQIPEKRGCRNPMLCKACFCRDYSSNVTVDC